MTEMVDAYVIVLNFVLILGAALLAFLFLYGKEKKLFRPMGIERVLIVLITLYSIFADQLLRSSSQFAFLIQPPWRPAIFRTPLAIGTWLVLLTLYGWLKKNGNGNQQK